MDKSSTLRPPPRTFPHPPLLQNLLQLPGATRLQNREITLKPTASLRTKMYPAEINKKKTCVKYPLMALCHFSTHVYSKAECPIIVKRFLLTQGVMLSSSHLHPRGQDSRPRSCPHCCLETGPDVWSSISTCMAIRWVR